MQILDQFSNYAGAKSAALEDEDHAAHVAALGSFWVTVTFEPGEEPPEGMTIIAFADEIASLRKLRAREGATPS